VHHYVFDFNHYGGLDKFFEVGASHAFDLPLVFRNRIGVLSDLFSARAKNKWFEMSDLLSCTWASFVKCQEPKCLSDPPPHCQQTYQTLPEWTQFSAPDNRNYLHLTLKPTIEYIQAEADMDASFAGDNRCNFWERAHFKWHNPHNYFEKLQQDFHRQDSSVVVV
jgi:hypothetical protein